MKTIFASELAPGMVLVENEERLPVISILEKDETLVSLTLQGIHGTIRYAILSPRQFVTIAEHTAEHGGYKHHSSYPEKHYPSKRYHYSHPHR